MLSTDPFWTLKFSLHEIMLPVTRKIFHLVSNGLTVKKARKTNTFLWNLSFSRAFTLREFFASLLRPHSTAPTVLNLRVSIKNWSFHSGLAVKPKVAGYHAKNTHRLWKSSEDVLSFNSDCISDVTEIVAYLLEYKLLGLCHKFVVVKCVMWKYSTA